MKYTAMPPPTHSPCSTIPRKRFNTNDRKYRCCCGGQCHVRTGAMFVGALEIILICLLMIAAGVWFVYDGYRQPDHQSRFTLNYWSLIWLSSALSLGLIVVITVAFLFAGIVRERRYLLWPHMVAQWVMMIVFAGLLVYSIIYTILAAETLAALNDNQGDDRRYFAVKRVVLYSVQTAACFVGLILFIVFFRLVYRCYHYLRDADLHEKKNRYSTQSSPNSTLHGRQTLIIETGGLLTGVKN